MSRTTYALYHHWVEAFTKQVQLSAQSSVMVIYTNRSKLFYEAPQLFVQMRKTFIREDLFKQAEMFYESNNTIK